MASYIFLSLMNGAPWGGSEELWYRAALKARKQGHDVTCVLYHWQRKESRTAELQKMGASITWLPNRGREKKTLADKIRYRISKLKLLRTIRNFKFDAYDHIIISQGGYEITEDKWKDLYKKLPPFTLLFHNYNEQDKFSPAKKRILEDWLNGAGKNLFAADRIRTHLEKHLGLAVPNADVLYNPLGFPIPEVPGPWPALRNGNFVFLMLAALDTKRKAQDHLVKALSGSRWKNRNWELDLYGSGNDEDMLRKLVAEAGLSSKVFIRGHGSDVRTILSQSHLFLQVTHMDAMPISLTEAMAIARPAIVSPVGDMALWVGNENGWIAASASVEAIEEALETAWEQRNLWEEKGKASFRILKERFPADALQYFLDQVV